jgi:hypothetical protein
MTRSSFDLPIGKREKQMKNLTRVNEIVALFVGLLCAVPAFGAVYGAVIMPEKAPLMLALQIFSTLLAAKSFNGDFRRVITAIAPYLEQVKRGAFIGSAVFFAPLPVALLSFPAYLAVMGVALLVIVEWTLLDLWSNMPNVPRSNVRRPAMSRGGRACYRARRFARQNFAR